MYRKKRPENLKNEAKLTQIKYRQASYMSMAEYQKYYDDPSFEFAKIYIPEWYDIHFTDIVMEKDSSIMNDLQPDTCGDHENHDNLYYEESDLNIEFESGMEKTNALNLIINKKIFLIISIIF